MRYAVAIFGVFELVMALVCLFKTDLFVGEGKALVFVAIRLYGSVGLILGFMLFAMYRHWSHLIFFRKMFLIYGLSQMFRAFIFWGAGAVDTAMEVFFVVHMICVVGILAIYFTDKTTWDDGK